MTDSAFVHGAATSQRGVAARAMRWLGSATFFAALMAGSNGALAANANFVVTVTPVAASVSSPASVSLGRNGLTTYAAYRVSITNSSGNTNNGIRFTGSTVVSGDSTAGLDAGALAPYVETIPKTACTGSGSTVQCDFSQMQAGANNSFVLIFAAPALTAAVQWANAAINFNWSFDYSSGNSSGTPSSILCNGVQIASPPCTGSALTGLITSSGDAILAGFVTYIPSFGGTFFTGNGASVLPPTGTDLLPTAALKITVPTGQNLTTALADLTVVLGGLTGDTTTTNTGVIQVPNNQQLFGTYATIELRRDASTIANGAKIANATVLYSHDDGGTPTTLPNCPANGDPSSFIPPVCLFSKTEFTKKTAPTPADVGDWLFVLHALENGVSRW